MDYIILSLIAFVVICIACFFIFRPPKHQLQLADVFASAEAEADKKFEMAEHQILVGQKVQLEVDGEVKDGYRVPMSSRPGHFYYDTHGSMIDDMVYDVVLLNDEEQEEEFIESPNPFTLKHKSINIEELTNLPLKKK